MNSAADKIAIGGVTVPGRVFLAPMAGYTDCAMRVLASRAGAAMTTTEMVSVKGICYRTANTAALLRRSTEEGVTAVQLFGHEPEFFIEAIKNSGALDGFDVIDVNMGCPVPKIVKNGDGSALIGDRRRAERVVEACVLAAGGRPVTVKTRLGIRAGEDVSRDFCAAMEGAGAAAITLHARTASAGYSGTADWDKIEALKASLNIPVIGSGDVDEFNAADLLKRADAVTIGRKAVGDPWIFARVLGRPVPMDAAETLLEHFDLALEFYGERYACVNLRKHIGRYLRSFPGARELKLRLMAAETETEFRAALGEAMKD